MCYFLMMISFYPRNNHNYKKSKESKTDLKVIAADIIDDTDLLCRGCGLPTPRPPPGTVRHLSFFPGPEV